MVGIYTRVHGQDFQNQKIQLDYCKSLLTEGEQFEVYSDLGNTISARDKMMNDIKSGIITKIITYDFSRLSRNQEEIKDILIALDNNDMKLVTFKDGEINKFMLSIFLELESIEDESISASN